MLVVFFCWPEAPHILFILTFPSLFIFVFISPFLFLFLFPFPYLFLFLYPFPFLSFPFTCRPD